MNFTKLPTYMKAVLRAAFRNRPRDYLRMLSDSPLAVKNLPDHGVSLIVDSRDPAISKPILCIGQYEKNVTDVLLSLVKDDTCFVDVGANIGYFTLLVARRCPRGKVFSFEPDPANYAVLKANVALNRLEDVISAHRLAVSDEDGKVYFSDLGNPANLGARFTAKEAATLREHSAAGAAAPVEIDAVRLDTFLKDERVDLVKVDIEGHEPAAFRGMRNLLERQRPTIVTEFAPGTIQHISKSDPAELLKFFAELKYGLSVIDDDGSVRPADADAVMARFSRNRTHHIDLLLRPA